MKGLTEIINSKIRKVNSKMRLLTTIYAWKDGIFTAILLTL